MGDDAKPCTRLAPCRTSAGTGHDVVPRGLIFQAAPCAAVGALHGIRFLSGRSLRVEDTTSDGFSG